MRWLPQTSLLILLMAWPAAAQAQFPLPPRPRPQPEDTPKFELAPVYSINVVPTEQLSRIGASVSFAWNVSPEDGLFLDVGGYRLPATPQQQRLLTYMAGYRRSARNSRYVNLFVQGALGGAHLSANGGIITQSQRLTAASAGVGAD